MQAPNYYDELVITKPFLHLNNYDLKLIRTFLQTDGHVVKVQRPNHISQIMFNVIDIVHDERHLLVSHNDDMYVIELAQLPIVD